MEMTTVPNDGELYRSILRIENTVEKILIQTSKTNGRVTTLETNQAVQAGKLEIVTNIFKWAVGIPTTLFITVAGSLLYAWIHR